MNMSEQNIPGNWVEICELDEITPNSGICALVDGEQVAVFRIEKDNQLFAVSNYDPFGEANVLSRGIVGTVGEKIVVASPLYKQHFCLSTGQCLQEYDVKIKSYLVKEEAGKVKVAA